MRPLNIEEVTRRAFLIRSAVTLGGFSPLVRVFPATALGALQGRAELSEASLAGYLQTVRARGPLAVDNLLAEVREDVGTFLRKRFALNPTQEAFVSRLTPKDIAGIRTAFERGLVGKNELQIRIPDPGVSGQKCDMTVNRGDLPRVSGQAVEAWSVVIVRP